MNKEVVCANGIVSVIDENGNERKVNGIDNLDDILIQENIVEIIQKVIEALEAKSAIFNRSKPKDILYIQAPIISTLLISTIMTYLNTGSLAGVINTKFGVMEKGKFLAFFIVAFIPFAYRISKVWYKDYKDELKSENGRLLALYHLKSNLAIQNMKLDMLREKSKEIIVEDDKRYFVDHDDKVEILQDHINLYYELGYNIKEYYEYFRNNGCLPEEVRQDYNDAGVQIIEEYLKTNGNKIKKISRKK